MLFKINHSLFFCFLPSGVRRKVLHAVFHPAADPAVHRDPPRGEAVPPAGRHHLAASPQPQRTGGGGVQAAQGQPVFTWMSLRSRGVGWESKMTRIAPYRGHIIFTSIAQRCTRKQRAFIQQVLQKKRCFFFSVSAIWPLLRKHLDHCLTATESLQEDGKHKASQIQRSEMTQRGTPAKSNHFNIYTETR